MLHDSAMFLLGAIALFMGLYAWWTHRRFTALKDLLKDALFRMDPIERLVDEHGQAIDRVFGRIQEAEHRIEFLLENRAVPPDTRDRAIAERKQEKTAWDHLREKLDGI